MEKKSRYFYTFSFKLITFITLFIITILFFSRHVSLKYDNRLKSTITYLENTKDSVNYDIFFFSNSYVFTAIDPLYLKHLSGLNSLHFGSDAQRVTYTIETVKNILKIQTPKCIVLDLSYYSTFLPESEEIKSYQSKGLLTIGFSWSKLWTILRTITFNIEKDFFLNSVSRITATINGLNKWDNYVKAAKHKTGYLGYKYLLHPKKEVSKDNFENNYNDTTRLHKKFFDEYSRTKIFDFLRQLTNKSNIKIVLISSIKINSKIEGDFTEVVSALKEISPNIFSINLNEPIVKKELALVPSSFQNGSHLQHSGALAVTKYLAPKFSLILGNKDPAIGRLFKTLEFRNKLIIRDYKLVLDENFEKTLQFYLDSVPSGFQGHQAVVQVFPKEGCENKLLPYSIKKNRVYDAFYLPLEELINFNNEQIGTLLLGTQLKNNEIEKIELWFYKSKGLGSGKKVIYQSGNL